MDKKIRIIGGLFRGRKLRCPPHDRTRPTKDRVREAVFDLLAGLAYEKVMDLFAGSGAYGLEAVSRGAVEAVFVESDRISADTIKENIGVLTPDARTEVLVKDAFTVMDSFEKGYFDLIFADPPYTDSVSRKTLIMINHYDILMPNGFFVLEHRGAESVPEVEGNLSLYKQKTYGDTTVSIFVKK